MTNGAVRVYKIATKKECCHMKFRDHLKEQLKDEEFKREYEKQEKYIPDDLADIYPWLERGVYLRVKE